MRVKVSHKIQFLLTKIFLVLESELSSTAESDHSFRYSCGEQEQGQGTSEPLMPQQGIFPQLSDPAIYGKPRI